MPDVTIAKVAVSGIPFRLDRKPISTAIDEVYTGKLTITSQGTENEEIE